MFWPRRSMIWGVRGAAFLRVRRRSNGFSFKYRKQESIVAPPQVSSPWKPIPSRIGAAGSICGVAMRVAAIDWWPSRSTVLLKRTVFTLLITLYYDILLVNQYELIFQAQSSSVSCSCRAFTFQISEPIYSGSLPRLSRNCQELALICSRCGLHRGCAARGRGAPAFGCLHPQRNGGINPVRVQNVSAHRHSPVMRMRKSACFFRSFKAICSLVRPDETLLGTTPA